MLTSAITIEPWMPRLGLRGAALLIYAYIYYQSFEGYMWYPVDEDELRNFAVWGDQSVTRIVAHLINDNILYWEIHEGKPVVKPNINTIYERVGQAYTESKR